MPSSYTSSLRFELQAAGENLNTWGAPKLNNVISRIDFAIAGRTALSLGSATTYTLTSSNTSDDEARAAIIDITSLTAACQITIPAVSKTYVIRNQGSAKATFTAGGSGTVEVESGDIIKVFCDGSNVYELGYAGYGLKDYIDQAVLAATGSLPATTGNSGKYLYCDGSTWLPRAIVAADISDFGAARTWTTKQTFAGSSSVLASVFANAAETTTISATAATGTINFDIATQSVLYYTSNAAANWTVNLRHLSGTSLDSVMSVGQSITVAFAVTQGATPYYNSSVQVDGTTSGVTTKWLNAAPSAGVASSVNVYQYVITKTGSATFTVLASLAAFV